MNKKILFPVFMFLSVSFCFSQNESFPPSSPENPEPAPSEITEITPPDSLAPAPSGENQVRDFQLTLLTPIGTNGTNASKITNKLSINAFAGINGGLNGIEVGGFANVITGEAVGLQAAGFANVVRGNFDGIQAAGFANSNLKKSKGIQTAGFVNTSLGGFEGVQAAGFVNFARGNSEGIQATGFINYAKNLKGLQLGFINIADTLDGFSIGFLSYARNGYHVLEASTNETFQANLSFKTGGSHYFYNIFSAGTRLNGDDSHWAFGYGIGSKFMLTKRFGVNADAISYAIIPRTIDANQDWEDQDFGAVGKLNLGLSFKVAKHFTVYGGPTLNILINQNESFIDNINPREIFTATDDDVNVIIYPGFNVGIRI